ncbi:hypothetical protein FQA39_LY17817 [Lamprigera yunnana]|nr:hypothetical protein FQA39_LY17817 [Lamprigera yunnana]
MRKELRQILALEKLEKTMDYPKCVIVFDDEVSICEEKWNVLKSKISMFTCDSSRRKILILNSRLSHLMCRVDNIPMTNVDKKTRHATLVSKILLVSEQLNVKLKSQIQFIKKKMWMLYAEQHWTKAIDLKSAVERLYEKLGAVEFDADHEAIYGMEKYYTVEQCKKLRDKYKLGRKVCRQFLMGRRVLNFL